MLRLLRVAVCGLLALACGPLSLSDAGGLACQEDSECTAPRLCILARCVDPRAQTLDRVDVLVSPLPDTGLKAQALGDLSLSAGGRTELVLRPTVRLGVRTCFSCAGSPPGPLAGTLQLTTPSVVDGIQQVEAVTLDGLMPAQVGLLPFTPYQPVLFPQDVTLPLLRGGAVFASSSSTVEVEMPNPNQTFLLSGRVVRNALATDLVPVGGLRVWVSQGTQRLTRDVLTDDQGRFEARVLTQTASALELHLAPAEGQSALPELTLGGIDLNADRDLGLVDLGLGQEPVTVTGTVRAPGQAPLAGAQVLFWGVAGAGTVRAVASTDQAGAFVLALMPGFYGRAVLPPGGSNASLDQQDAVVVEPGETAVMDVQLGQRPQLCGTVRSSAGVGVWQARVQSVRLSNALEAPGPAQVATDDVRTTTRDDGSFCLSVLPGRHLVSAQPPEASGWPARSDVVDVGSLDVVHDFHLPRAAWLTGTVRGPDQRGLGLARIKAFSSTLSTARGALELGETFSDGNGNFALPLPDYSPSVDGGASAP